MRTAEVSRILDRPTVTIRKWAAEFCDYLSTAAQGGKARDFTEQDARILAYISWLVEVGKTREGIHDELQRLATGQWDDLPALPEARTAIETDSVSPELLILRQRTSEIETQLGQERETHQETQIELLKAREQLAELRGLLTRLQAVDLDRQQMQADLLMAHKSMGQLEAEREQLRQEQAQLKQQNLDLQSDHQTARQRWRRVLLMAVIGIAVLVIVVVALLTVA